MVRRGSSAGAAEAEASCGRSRRVAVLERYTNARKSYKPWAIIGATRSWYSNASHPRKPPTAIANAKYSFESACARPNSKLVITKPRIGVVHSPSLVCRTPRNSNSSPTPAKLATIANCTNAAGREHFVDQPFDLLAKLPQQWPLGIHQPPEDDEHRHGRHQAAHNRGCQRDAQRRELVAQRNVKHPGEDEGADCQAALDHDGHCETIGALCGGVHFHSAFSSRRAVVIGGCPATMVALTARRR